jgi:hypothetical protein
MSLKAICFTTMAAVASVQGAGWGGPDMHKTCTDCTNAGMTWQKEANRCTAKCDIPDISCQRKPADCTPKPVEPETFDCYVDLRGSGMKYINIWRKKPCTSKWGSLGALYQVHPGLLLEVAVS